MINRQRPVRIRSIVLVTLACCVSRPITAQTPVPQAEPATTSPTEKDIVVTARRGGDVEKIDRSVYEVKAGPDAASSSTVDVLKRLPGVTLGPGDTVTIRGGARVAYLIDGKPTRQEVALAIPASQIAKVEVIANPSAELDPRGEALINLILKQTAKAGWSGNASVQTDTLGGFKAGLDVARGGAAWAINGNVSFRSAPLRTEILRQTNFALPGNGSYAQTLDVDNHTTTNRLSTQIRLNKGKEGENLTSITVGGSFTYVPQDEQITQTTISSQSEANDHLKRLLRFHGSYPFAIVSLDRKLGDGFTLQVSLNSIAGSSRDDRLTLGSENQTNSEKLKFAFVEPGLTIQKLLGNAKLSVGTTFSANPVRSNLETVGIILPDGSSGQKTDFGFNRNQYAWFATYEKRLFGIETKSAIRVEDITQRFSSQNLPLAGLRSIRRVLPSLYLSSKPTKRSTIKASVTFRSDLPDAENLNPVRRFLSPFFAEQGNPFLIPSLKRLFDVTYILDISGLNISQSLFYRTVAHEVSQYDSSDLTGLTVSTFANLASSQTLGYSLLLKAKVSRNLQLGGGLDLVHRTAASSESLSYLGRVKYESVNANATADFTIDKKNTISAQWSYQGRTFDPGIETPSFSTSEVKASHKISKKISLDFVLADVAVPLNRLSRFYGANIMGTEESNRHSRLVRIGLSTAL